MECPFARKVWFGSRINIKFPDNTSPNFKDWLHYLIATTDAETIIYAASIIYNLWFARNKLIFEEINRNEVEVLDLTIKSIQDYKACNTINNKAEEMKTTHASNSDSRRRAKSSKWRKPEANYYKINTDANLSEANIWGMGAIVRDESGDVFAAATWRMDGFEDPTAAEAYAVYLAVEFAAECGFLDVVVETDCEKIVKFLCENETIPNNYVGNVIRGIKIRATRFRHVSFNFVGRKGNEAAHKLAHHALIEPNKVWIEECPACIVSEILRDIIHQ
jgi:ribonuclease HI